MVNTSTANKGNRNLKFKPFVGRCFELKSFTDLKKYPKVVLVMDETKSDVMFLDMEGNATWISKFYLRDTPVESRVFASSDTLTTTMGLIEFLRDIAVEQLMTDKEDEKKPKKIKEINKRCGQVLQELRDLGTRTKGVAFAPPEEEEEVVSGEVGGDESVG